MRASWQLLTLAILLLLMGGALILQRQSNGELRSMIVLLRDQNHEVTRLREEQLKLMKAQISEAELDSLRADHAAVARLRAEIETAQARIIEMERTEAAGAPAR